MELPAEKFHGVDVLIDRMQTHPEEFFEHQNRLSVDKSSGRWTFIFKEYFRDCLTEAEKGRIHEAIRAVRRLEFDALVLKELMRDEEAEKRQAQQGIISAPGQYQLFNQQAQSALQAGVGLQASPFGAVPKESK